MRAARGSFDAAVAAAKKEGKSPKEIYEIESENVGEIF
jgi:hypothetical protein